MTIKWVISDPLVMNGEPFCYGSRLTVRNLLEMRRAGRSPADMLAEHPELRRVVSDPSAIRALSPFADAAMQACPPRRRQSLVEDLLIERVDETVASRRRSRHGLHAAPAQQLTLGSQVLTPLLDSFLLFREARGHRRRRELRAGRRRGLDHPSCVWRQPLELLLDHLSQAVRHRAGDVLDPLGIRRMKNSIIKRARGGATIVLSSHLLHLLEEVCTHVLILKQGEKIADGTLAEVAARFSNGEVNVSLEDIFIRATGGTE